MDAALLRRLSLLEFKGNGDLGDCGCPSECVAAD